MEREDGEFFWQGFFKLWLNVLLNCYYYGNEFMVFLYIENIYYFCKKKILYVCYVYFMWYLFI